MNLGPIVRAMRHNRTRVVLIVLEIGMTLAIVTNCVAVILAERAKMSQRSGFDDDNIVWVLARPFSTEYRKDEVLGRTIASDLRTIRAIPGVRAVANTSFQLWEGGGSSSGVRALGTTGEPLVTQIYHGTNDLVKALGATISEGRGFGEPDLALAGKPKPRRVAVITRTVANDLFPGQSPLGKVIHEDDQEGATRPITVIGVMEEFYNPWGIGAGNHVALAERGVFLTSGVGSYERGIPYLIRTEPGAMASVIPEVEKRLTAADPRRVFEFVRTDEKRDRWFSSGQIVVTTMTCIIVALVSVTALGLLGLTSLAVAERTRQIGTRRALGATRADILLHFLLENWLLTAAGLALGVIGAWALDFLLVSRVSEGKIGWELIAAGAVLLVGGSLLSTLPPAWRASAVPPSVATRSV